MSVIEAEMLWLFKIAEEDQCFASRDHLDKLFVRMFKDCNVAEMFFVSHTKSSCGVWHGLGPVVRDKLIKSINKSGNMFTLLPDKTTAKQIVKQMDFLVQYWSETETQNVTRFLGHVKADDLCVKVMDVLEKNFLDTQLFLIFQ